MSGKKDQRRQLREAKKEAAKRRDKFLGLAWKAALVVLVPLVAVVLFQGLFRNAQLPAPSEITELDHVRGTAGAPVTLTIYADFQCPACEKEQQLIGRAWSRISDKVQLVYRHFPLDVHKHAFLAARYAEAAARQDSFWQMHDVLFANQALWSNSNSAEELFGSYARQLGLDMEQLRADLELSDIRDKISGDQRGGIKAGVRSTPSLFVNGRLVPNLSSTAELIRLVTNELPQLAE